MTRVMERNRLTELIFYVLLASLYATDAIPHRCETVKRTELVVKDKCGNYELQKDAGYNLDREKSGLKNYTDRALNGLMWMWKKDVSSSPPCVFTRESFRNVTDCCGGWSGAKCDKPVCLPSCFNGGECISPMMCKCKPDYTGPCCNETIASVTSTKKYCYLKSSCFGDKALNAYDVVTKDVCCSKLLGGQGWGLIGHECVPCLPNVTEPLDLMSLTPDHPNVIINPGGLAYRTCMSMGPNYYRTFDGLEFLFGGRCTYNLLEIDSLSIRISVKMINCYSYVRCRKQLQIERGDILVIAEGGNILVNGDPVNIMIGMGYASPTNGLRIDLRGDYYYLSTPDMLRVRWDDRSTYFITFEGLSGLNLTTSGMCGDYNLYPYDDLTTPNGAIVTDPYEFGTSWLVSTTNLCSDTRRTSFACKTIADENKAKDACGLLLQAPFKQCHSTVFVSPYYARCVNDYCTAGLVDGEPLDQAKERESALCQTLSSYSQMCTLRNIIFSWRKNSLCPRTCPDNMYYTECSPKCLKTCGNMYTLSPQSCEGECYPGCQCLPGKVLNNSQCIDANQCPCEYQGQFHGAGSSVDIGCNQCECVSGQWMCTGKLCAKTCSILGFQHFTTFDGAKYDFHGPPCSYTLVELNEKALVDWSVLSRGTLHVAYSVKNCEPGKKVSCTTGVQILYTKDQQTYRISIDQNFVILVNGVEMENAFESYINENIYVKQVTSLFVLVEAHGFRVLYDRNGRIYVRLDPFYGGKVRGLCGNMDGSILEELKSRRNIEEDVVAFAMSYSDCPAQISKALSTVDWCSVNKVPTAVGSPDLCAFVGNPGIFGGCLDALDWKVYRDYCKADICAAEKPAVAVCTMMSALAHKCCQLGFLVEWMNNPTLFKLCQMRHGYTCSQFKGQSYSEDATPFGNCRDMQYQSNIPDADTCLGGCHCGKNELLNDYRVCSAVKDCTCYDQYTKGIYNAGARVKQLCTDCICANGTWDCGNVDCAKKVVCPHNQVFRRNITNCGATCDTLDLPGDFCKKDEPLFDGCGCRPGLVMLPNGTCILPDQCPCKYNGVEYSSGATVSVGCITYLCSKHNWVKNATKKDCERTCTAYGDPHYRTFDGYFYSFQGVCEYILTRLKISQNFSVIAENVPCGSLGTTCTKAVTIKDNANKIRLVRDLLPNVNGKDVKLTSEYKFNGGKLLSTDLFIIVVLDSGMVVQWDALTRAYISLPEKYKGKVEGLCGNYDDNYENEFLDLASGQLATTPMAFARRWKTSPSCPDNMTNVEIAPCEKNKVRAVWAAKQCKIITEGSTFESCRRQVSSFTRFYQNCLFDTCGCDDGGDCECLCTAVAAFAKECSSQGINVKWRTNRFCPIMCERGMDYSPCVSPCRPTCDNVGSDLSKECKDLDCVEGCICPDDLVLNDLGVCVPVSKCSCKYQGRQFTTGTVIDINCQKCVCINGKFVCTGPPCKYNCTKEEFLCPIENKCIPLSHKCDRISDCVKDFDEINCTTACEPDEFACNRIGQCVPQKYVCDGRRDCMDGSDELVCDACKDPKFFQCRSVRCIPQSFVCDGKLDCGLNDNSDEFNCTEVCSEPDYFHCKNSKCLPKHIVCDEHDDCGDGSDELNCTPICPPHHEQIEYKHGVDGFIILANGIDNGEDALLGSQQFLPLLGNDIFNNLTIVRVFQPDVFTVIAIKLCVTGKKLTVSFRFRTKSGNSELIQALYSDGMYYLDTITGVQENIKMISILIKGSGDLLRVERLSVIICIPEVPPPPQCSYGYDMVTYKFDQPGFVTLLDNKPNTDILEGSGKVIVLDNTAVHRIVIKRDRLPKIFNVLSIKITVMGAGLITYNLTSVNGQSELKLIPVTEEDEVILYDGSLSKLVDISTVVMTLKITSYSLTVECLTMIACVPFPEPICLHPMTLNYRNTFESIVLLRNISGPFNYSVPSGKDLGDLDPDVLKTLKYSIIVLPNIELTPRVLYLYTIELTQPCPDTYLILNFTFTIEGVRDLKVMIGNDTILEKPKLVERPYFTFVLTEPVKGDILSVSFISNQRKICFFNVEVEMCCDNLTTPQLTTTTGPCTDPLMVVYNSHRLFDVSLVNDKGKIVGDAIQVLQGSAVKWRAPPFVTGPFSIVLLLLEPCDQWVIESFEFTLEGILEFSIIVDGKYLMHSEKVLKFPALYKKDGPFLGSNFTLLVHKREKIATICDMIVIACCESTSTTEMLTTIPTTVLTTTIPTTTVLTTTIPTTTIPTTTIPTTTVPTTTLPTTTIPTTTLPTTTITTIPATVQPQPKCEVYPIPLQEVFVRTNVNCDLVNDINVTQCRGSCGDSMVFSKLNFTFFTPLLEFKDCQCCESDGGYWEPMTVECVDNGNLTFSAWIHTSCKCDVCTPPPPTPCDSDKFQCRFVHNCIEKHKVCDRFEDCEDGSDEKDCDYNARKR